MAETGKIIHTTGGACPFLPPLKVEGTVGFPIDIGASALKTRKYFVCISLSTFLYLFRFVREIFVAGVSSPSESNVHLLKC